MAFCRLLLAYKIVNLQQKPYLQHLLVLKIGVFQENPGFAAKKIKIVFFVNKKFTTKKPVLGLFLVI